jgi:hypothetical protein
MDGRDPHEWVNEPLRQALDGVLYRWLALFCAPVAIAAVHKLAGDPSLDCALHVCLPAFVAGYVGVHLVGRLFWHGRGPLDGWSRAREADRGTVALTRTIGWVALVGAGLAIVAPLGTLEDPHQFLMEVLLWFPLYFPLYCLAVWVTIDCARHRLGKGVDASQHRVLEYWHEVGRTGRPPA